MSLCRSTGLSPLPVTLTLPPGLLLLLPWIPDRSRIRIPRGLRHLRHWILKNGLSQHGLAAVLDLFTAWELTLDFCLFFRWAVVYFACFYFPPFLQSTFVRQRTLRFFLTAIFDDLLAFSPSFSFTLWLLYCHFSFMSIRPILRLFSTFCLGRFGPVWAAAKSGGAHVEVAWNNIFKCSEIVPTESFVFPSPLLERELVNKNIHNRY